MDHSTDETIGMKLRGFRIKEKIARPHTKAMRLDVIPFEP
jgi:hypothetical protein